MNELYNEICKQWVEYCDMFDAKVEVSATVRKQKYIGLLGMYHAYRIVYGKSLKFNTIERTVKEVD